MNPTLPSVLTDQLFQECLLLNQRAPPDALLHPPVPTPLCSPHALAHDFNTVQHSPLVTC